MAFTAADVMRRAATTLQDESSVRWKATELHSYLNDGILAVVELKPTAKSETVNLPLVAGTLQTLPEQYTTLSRVICNVLDDVPLTLGAVITPINSRDLMDMLVPGWHDPTIVPYSRQVVHVIHEITNPRSYHVVPGNNATGMIRAVVSAKPAPVASPTAPSDAVIANYTAEVDLPDEFRMALADYVLYRAYSKDARLAGSAARAQAHFDLFRASVANLTAGEVGMSLAAANAAPPQQKGGR